GVGLHHGVRCGVGGCRGGGRARDARAGPRAGAFRRGRGGCRRGVSAVATDREASLEELRESLMALFGAQRRLRGRDARIEGGVSFAHYPLLSALAREGSLSAGQLATGAGLTPASVTQV